jgi:hypothetical protein
VAPAADRNRTRTSARTWRAARRPASLSLSVLAITLALAGCGESKQEQATKTVCSARADIKANVEHLASITPSVAALSEIQAGLTAITDDLGKIKDAQGDLAPARKQEVEKATQEFATRIGSDLSSTVASLASGKISTELKSALEDLAAAYTKALGAISCS